jgi:TatD DNase family protein
MDKKSIIGFVLMGLILFGYSWFQGEQDKKASEAYMAAQREQFVADSIDRAEHPEKYLHELVEQQNDAKHNEAIAAYQQQAQERFESELEGSVDEFIDALLSEKVSAIVNIGTMPSTSRAAVEQAKKHDRMYTAIGIHPGDTRFLSDMESELKEIEEMILDPRSKCVCLGEIGLDYHYPETDKEKQMAYLVAQMEMAKRLDMPVAIHDREAHEDIMTVIRRYPEVKGVMHSFSGSAEMAKELVSLGYMISFSGTLTFTNARRPKEAAAAIPPEYIMIETDAPYLAPTPHRGKINHSGYLSYTNARLAEIKGITQEECARITDANARRLFNLK